ncbi:MAG TPA: hypothetical protein VI981_02505 [Candidatus Paceibacterota bacterium]
MLSKKLYTLLTGLIFTVVVLIHLARIWAEWAVEVGPYSVPTAASWIAVVLAGYLAYNGFRLHGKD